MTAERSMRLGDLITDISAGVSLQGENRLPEANEAGILTLSALSGATLDPSACKAVNARLVAKLGRTVRGGTILMSRSNTPALVGACVYVEKDVSDRHLPDLIWEIALHKDAPCSARWLVEYFRSSHGRRSLLLAAAGTSGTMIKLSMNRLRRLTVDIPPIEVQEAIVRCANHLDRTADILSLLIKAKLRFRQNLLRELVTGKRRYPNFVKSYDLQPGQIGLVPRDWAVVAISEVADEVKDRGAVDGAVVYSCTKHDGLVPSMEYFGKQVFSRNLEGYRRLEPGDFAYATNHIEEGSIGLLRMGKPIGLVSPMYTVFRPTASVDAEYLIALLKTESYRRIFQARMSASVNRRGSLRWEEFSRIRVGLPTIEEQRRIGQTLGLIDEEIGGLDRLLNATARYKRALISRLLSGDISVPV